MSNDDWSEDWTDDWVIEVKTRMILATFVVAGWLIEKEIRDLFLLKRKKGDLTLIGVKTGDFGVTVQASQKHKKQRQTGKWRYN